MRNTNDRRRNNEKTHYHKNPTKIAANPGLFPCQIDDTSVQWSSKHPQESNLYKLLRKYII